MSQSLFLESPTELSPNTEKEGIKLHPRDPRRRLSKVFVFRTHGKAHLYWSTALTIICIGLSIGFGYMWKLPEVEALVPLKVSSDTPKISMEINFVSVDVTAGTVTADWYPLAFDCNLPEVVAAIFFDPNLLISDSSSATGTQDPPSTPTFVFNSTTRCHGSIRNSFSTFRTVSKINGNGGTSWGEGSSLQNYPFDRYFTQISLFATTNDTGNPVGISVDRSFGVPVNIKTTLDKELSRNDENGLYIVLFIRRSASLKTLVFTIFIGNWLITVCFLWVTTAALVWPADTVKELFAIPLATLFAFTSVRANLPGAPDGFGAFLDYIGILPNLVLMTLCGALLLIVMLWRRVNETLQTFQGGSYGAP